MKKVRRCSLALNRFWNETLAARSGLGVVSALILQASLDLSRISGHKVKQYFEGVGKAYGRDEKEIHQRVQA